MAEGKFRQDLLYRLDVITIRMPSLAERREDIRELAAFFCAEECRKEGFPPRELSREALRALETAEWPGNVRDLSNAVARGVLRAVADGALQVERRHLFPDGADPAADPDRATHTYEEAVNRFKAQLAARHARADRLERRRDREAARPGALAPLQPDRRARHRARAATLRQSGTR